MAKQPLINIEYRYKIEGESFIAPITCSLLNSRDNGDGTFTITDIPNENIAEGDFQVRVKALDGNPPSAWLSSNAVFSATSLEGIIFERPNYMSVGNDDQNLIATSSVLGSAITFTSSNLAIATIVDGKLHAVSNGIVEITASGSEGETAITKKVWIGDYGNEIDLNTIPGLIDRFNITDPSKVVQASGSVSAITGVNNTLEQSDAGLKPHYITGGGTKDRNYINFNGGKVISKALPLPKSFPITYYFVIRQKSFINTYAGGHILRFGEGSYLNFRQGNGIGEGEPTTMPNIMIYTGSAIAEFYAAYREDWAVISGILGTGDDYVRVNDDLKVQKSYGTDIYPLNEIILGDDNQNADFDLAEMLLVEGVVDESADKDILYSLMKYHGIKREPALIGLGNSLVFGDVASSKNRNGYFYAASLTKKLLPVNYAIPSSMVAYDPPRPIDYQNQLPNTLARPITDNEIVYIGGYEANDTRAGGYDDGTGGYPPDASWKAKFKSGVQSLIDYGYEPSKIIIGTEPFQQNLSQMPLYIAIRQEVAEELGCRFIDVYAYTRDHGGASLTPSDNIHLNTEGHAVASIPLMTILDDML